MNTNELRSAGSKVERRVTCRLTDVSVRDAGEETGGNWISFIGHAAVFNQPTVLMQRQSYEVQEQIAPGAFRNVLASGSNVFLNHTHDMKQPMARTGVQGVGSLELREDATGLLVQARLDPTVSYIGDAVKLIRSGVLSDMSFAFIPGEEDGDMTVETTRDDSGYATNLITQVSIRSLFDVCICAMGAYPATDASVRELVEMRAIARDLDRGHAEERANEGVTETGTEIETVTQETVGSDAGVESNDGTDEERIAARKLEVRKIAAKLNTPTYKEIH